MLRIRGRSLTVNLRVQQTTMIISIKILMYRYVPYAVEKYFCCLADDLTVWKKVTTLNKKYHQANVALKSASTILESTE